MCTSGQFRALLMRKIRLSKCSSIFPRYIDSAPSAECFIFSTTVSATMLCAYVTRRICSIWSFIIYGSDTWWMLPLCWLNFFFCGHLQKTVWNKKLNVVFFGDVVQWKKRTTGRKKTCYNLEKKLFQLWREETWTWVKYSTFDGKNVRFGSILIGMMP